MIQSVSVLEGDSVTLHAGETQKEDLTVWTYGPDNTVIAMNTEIKIFRDRFLVNQSFGSLTIENITANFSGIYKFTVIRKSSYKTFKVTVYGEYSFGWLIIGYFFFVFLFFKVAIKIDYLKCDFLND